MDFRSTVKTSINGYTVEFTLTGPWRITYSVNTAIDHTRVSKDTFRVGLGSSVRQGDIDEESGDLVNSESLQDFAARAHKEGLEFAKSAIEEHKQTLELTKLLSQALAQ